MECPLHHADAASLLPERRSDSLHTRVTDLLSHVWIPESLNLKKYSGFAPARYVYVQAMTGVQA